LKKPRFLYISRYAPERSRTDPYTGLPWYLSERISLVGLWGRTRRPVPFENHCEKIINTNSEWWAIPRSVFAVRQFLRGNKGVDAVVCGIDEYSLCVGWVAGKLANAPVFCVVEDPPFTDRYAPPVGWIHQEEKRFRKILVSKFLGCCSGIFCFIEKEVLREFKLGVTPLYQFMNGVSSSALEWVQSGQSPPAQFSDFRIGYVGALNRRQGIDDLLEIFAQARKKISRLQLRLIGPLEKEYARDYYEKIEDLKLDGNVEVTGWLPYERMLKMLQECHIGVYCNQPNEWIRAAQPLKVCEYLALCIPTVAWDYPGVRRLLDGGRLGILIPQGQYSAFVNAIVQLANAYERDSYKAQIGLALETYWSSDYWYEEALRRILSSLAV
jgi:glycosyltransferase involved in cell wall biosynthesis